MKDKAVVELIIVLVLVGFGLWSLKKDPVTVGDDTTDIKQEIISTEDTSIGSVHANNPALATSYEQALANYGNARIELDQNCQATPRTATYRNGANIMIDNRSAQIRTIKVGYVFSIKAWSFKIVNLSSATAPTTWSVNCGNYQNIATIYIQR